MRSHCSPSFLLVAAIGACDAPPIPPITTTERDSAGVVIVENTIDTAAARVGWIIGETPELIVGGLESASAGHDLYQVSGARRLPDGRIAVADGGASAIRIYGPDGALVVTHGRKGEGPGEFMNPTLVGVRAHGDSLVVYDSGLRRASILHVDDGFVRSYPFGADGGGYLVPFGLAPDGGIAFGGGMFFTNQGGGFPTGAMRPNSRYVLARPDGSIRGDWGDVPAQEIFARADDTRFVAWPLPFGRTTTAAVGSTRLWLGTGDEWEIGAYTFDATLRRIVRIDRPLTPVTDALRDAELEALLEDADDDNEARAIRSAVGDMPIPDQVPPYQLFRIDALDHLWIGEYRLTGRVERDYTVVDPAGRVTGRVTMPPRTVPTDIGADYILGVTRDELDVEMLTLWTLERPEDRR